MSKILSILQQLLQHRAAGGHSAQTEKNRAMLKMLETLQHLETTSDCMNTDRNAKFNPKLALNSHHSTTQEYTCDKMIPEHSIHS